MDRPGRSRAQAPVQAQTGTTHRQPRLVSTVLATVGSAGGPTGGAAAAVRTTGATSQGLRATPGRWDRPSYGHDAQHTFHGRTTLTQQAARNLELAWTFPTGDAVTATPTVVGGSVYVGSWDGYFCDIALGHRAAPVEIPTQAPARRHAVSGGGSP